MEPRLVTSYSQVEAIKEGEYFVYDKGFQGCFQDEDLHAERKTKPYLICLKTGAESHRFRVLQERETVEQARQCINELIEGKND